MTASIAIKNCNADVYNFLKNNSANFGGDARLRCGTVASALCSDKRV